jgi:PAS domain S-box-containing protein
MKLSEPQLRAMVESGLDAFVLLDAEGRLVYQSPSAEPILGFSPRERVGRSAFEWVHPDDLDRARQEFVRLSATPGARSLIEVRVQHRDGTWHYVEAAASNCLHDPDVRAIVATFRDSTQRKETEIQRVLTEQTLRMSEARYRALLEEASDGIVVFDGHGVFQEVNPSFCSMLGYTRSELLGMRAWQVIAPEDLEREPIDWDMLRSGAVRRIERVFIRKDRSGVPAETRTKQLQDGRFLSIVRDITEHRQAAEALAALQQRDEQLRQAQKIEAIGRLAGGVAHDFNNVLTAIMGYADLLLDEFGSDDPRRQDIAEIKKAAERAAGLTRQLLAFSRKQVLQPVELDVNSIIGGIDRLLRRLLGDEVEVEFDAAPELPRVTADPGQLEQVLINLAVNSRDAMAEGGRVSVTTRAVTVSKADAVRLSPMPPGEYVTLSISDTGGGIDPDVLPHIFEPFFTTKPQGKGTGLGLATVYGIVKQSGGFIFVDTVAGKGATFTVYLPAVPAPAAEALSAAANPNDPVVLLVEDESAVRALAAGILRRQGYRVVEARDAAEAEALAARERRVDLLLTDVVMPGRNGHQLAQDLRTQRPRLRVVYMSGYTDESVRQAATRAGTPFLQKPFTPHALVNVVRETLTTSP